MGCALIGKVKLYLSIIGAISPVQTIPTNTNSKNYTIDSIAGIWSISGVIYRLCLTCMASRYG